MTLDPLTLNTPVMPKDRLGIGIVGSGFVAGFHLRALVSVRDADVCAIASPTREHTEAAAAQAKQLGVGDPAVCSTVAELAHDPMVDAIWICAPNDTRVAIVEEIADSVSEGAQLIGVACEKPLLV